MLCGVVLSCSAPTSTSTGRDDGSKSSVVQQASASWSVPGETVPESGTLGIVPDGMTLPAFPPGDPPGPAGKGSDSGDVPDRVLAGVTRLGISRSGDIADPDVAQHSFTLITETAITFDGPNYLAQHTSSAQRDDPLVRQWGLISGSLRAWHSTSQSPGALLIGSIVLAFPTPDAAAGALAHLASRGRGATDQINRFAVADIAEAVGLSYIEYPRSDGAPLPGEMIVFARDRYVAIVVTSGPQPSTGRIDLVDVAKIVDGQLR